MGLQEADLSRSVAIFELVMGAAIAALWTKDICASREVDRSRGLFRARDPRSGSLFWPHWLAEYGAAAALLIGGTGLLAGAGWARAVSFTAIGALLYTSVNSLSWTFARRERYVYAAPMLVGLVGGVVCLLLLAV